MITITEEKTSKDTKLCIKIVETDSAGNKMYLWVAETALNNAAAVRRIRKDAKIALKDIEGEYNV